MANNHDSAQSANGGQARTIRQRAVTAATAVAAGRVALGVVALARPSVPARPWVGASADDLAAQVFGRALGARDLALGLGALGALAALRQPRQAPAAAHAAAAAAAAHAASAASAAHAASAASAAPAATAATAASAWLAAGALSDSLDVAATVAAWPELPRYTRWLVTASACGAAVAGTAGAIALVVSGRNS